MSDAIPPPVTEPRPEVGHVGDDAKAESLSLSLSAAPMRAFHLAWISLFVAFFAWHSLSAVGRFLWSSPVLSPAQLRNLPLIAFIGNIIGRLVAGPLCDQFGARSVQTLLLLCAMLPLALAGTAGNYVASATVFFATGLLGAAFVPAAAWAAAMFGPRVAGTASAAVAALGSAGALASYPAMGRLARAIDVTRLPGVDAPGQLAVLVPAAALLPVAAAVFLLGADAPGGKRARWFRARGSAPRAALGAALNWRAWALCALYFGCGGAALAVQALAPFLPVTAGAGGARGAANDRLLIGLEALGLVARVAGGAASDAVAAWLGAGRARVWPLVATQAAAGAAVIVLSRSRAHSTATAAFAVIMVLANAAQGAVFAVVPFVDADATGTVIGVVAAGESVGSFAFGRMLRFWGFDAIAEGLLWIGVVLLASSVIAPALRWTPGLAPT